jgi:hypothetical protein
MKSLKNTMVPILLLCASFLLIAQAQANDASLAPKQIVTALIETMNANVPER